jgi:hypothetical protein
MSDLQPNDRVTWTHVSKRGRTVSMSLKQGVVLSVAGGLAMVKSERGTRHYTIPLVNLRRVGEKSTLTEFCDEVFAANREAPCPSPT